MTTIMKTMTVLVQDDVDINRFLQTLIGKLLSVSKGVGAVLSLKHSLVKNGDRRNCRHGLRIRSKTIFTQIAATKDKETDHAAMVASVQTPNEKDQKGDSNMGNVTADS